MEACRVAGNRIRECYGSYNERAFHHRSAGLSPQRGPRDWSRPPGTPPLRPKEAPISPPPSPPNPPEPPAHLSASSRLQKCNRSWPVRWNILYAQVDRGGHCSRPFWRVVCSGYGFVTLLWVIVTRSAVSGIETIRNRTKCENNL